MGNEDIEKENIIIEKGGDDNLLFFKSDPSVDPRRISL